MQYLAHTTSETPGKTRVQTLEEHLTHTAELAKLFASEIGLGEFGELLGLLHDLGKYSDAFQSYIRRNAEGFSLQNGTTDHSTAGAQFVWQETTQLNKDKSDKAFRNARAMVLALAIAGHHGGLFDIFSSDGKNNFEERINKDYNKTHLYEALQRIPPYMQERAKEIISSEAAFEKFKNFIAAVKEKEYGECNENKEDRFCFAVGCLTRFMFSVLVDADRCDTIDFSNGRPAHVRQNSKYIDWATLLERLEKRLAAFPQEGGLNKARMEVSDSCKKAAERGRGIYTLTVPTGGGKTLSSVRFALELAKRSARDSRPIKRIFYIIPYTTIIDQNAARLRDILETDEEKGDIVLECHSNLLEENDTPKGRLLSENWDAPIVLTTNVQFLDALFAGGTKSARRLHTLANSILIFDEIQALPVKTVHLFCNAINFLVKHCGATALLCTATQPLLNGVEKKYGALRYDEKNEIIKDAPTLFTKLKRVDIEDCRQDGGYSTDELADMAIEKQKDNLSVLVIVNTTKAARELYLNIKGKLAQDRDIAVAHMSALMCPTHRKTVLKDIKNTLEERKPLICVSTQVMEAGIDVDFNVVFRSLAGLDSIAQAAGRCNREGRMSSAHLYIVNPSDENIDELTDIKASSEAAKRVLREASLRANDDEEILSLGNIKQYFQYYFYNRAADMKYNVKTENGSGTLLDLLSYNRKFCGKRSQMLRQSFMTAGQHFDVIDAPTRGCIVQYGKGKDIAKALLAEDDANEIKKLLRQAQMFSVNIYRRQLEELQKNGGFYTPLKDASEKTPLLILREEFYSDEFGVSMEQVKPMSLEMI